MYALVRGNLIRSSELRTLIKTRAVAKTDGPGAAPRGLDPFCSHQEFSRDVRARLLNQCLSCSRKTHVLSLGVRVFSCYLGDGVGRWGVGEEREREGERNLCEPGLLLLLAGGFIHTRTELGVT